MFNNVFKLPICNIFKCKQPWNRRYLLIYTLIIIAIINHICITTFWTAEHILCINFLSTVCTHIVVPINILSNSINGSNNDKFPDLKECRIEKDH